jgi:hypothetical protein
MKHPSWRLVSFACSIPAVFPRFHPVNAYREASAVERGRYPNVLTGADPPGMLGAVRSC